MYRINSVTYNLHATGRASRYKIRIAFAPSGVPTARQLGAGRKEGIPLKIFFIEKLKHFLRVDRLCGIKW